MVPTHMAKADKSQCRHGDLPLLPSAQAGRRRQDDRAVRRPARHLELLHIQVLLPPRDHHAGAPAGGAHSAALPGNGLAMSRRPGIES
jgi:hypothetical protein